MAKAAPAPVELKMASAAVGDLVTLGAEAFGVWLVTSVSSDTPARVDLTLIGPARASAGVGRLIHSTTADQVAAIFKPAFIKES